MLPPDASSARAELPPREIGVGDLILTSAGAIADNFGTFLLVTVACVLPASVGRIALSEWSVAEVQSAPWSPYGSAQVDLPSKAVLVAMIVGGLLLMLAGYVAQAALTHTTVEYLAGRRIGAKEALGRGMLCVTTVFFVAILSGILVFGGFLFCFIPGVILLLGVYVSVPAAVMEGLGPIAAIRRSFVLMNGYRGTLLATLIIVFVAAYGLDFALKAAGGLDGAALQTLPTGRRAYFHLCTITVNVSSATFMGALPAVLYARIRGIEEGVDIEAL
ncbi:MAG: hypothetical protein OEY14_15185, partial [Myxococcales bacterium]|nr:hypothetical protein [Myxococcales bacterium]